MNILFCIIGCIITFVIGAFVSYLYIRPERLEIIQKNSNTEQLNKDLEKESIQLKKEKDNIEQELLILEERKKTLTDSLEQQKAQAEQYAKDLLNEKLALTNERYDRANEQLFQKYMDAEEECKQEYLDMMADLVKDTNKTIEEQQRQLEEVELQLLIAQEKQSAIIEQLKREEEKRTNILFYTLQLSDQDLKEISKLREVVPYLRNEEPLNKVIWKSYYEKPFTDLIGRLIGSEIVCGIYKITNLQDQKIYIGQSTNIKDRFRTHIKRGLGAETPTRNKLYIAMNKVGVENFSYEIIEKCPREQLNDREKYWIKYFQSQDYGYNETKGGS